MKQKTIRKLFPATLK
jgi:hypothetical protein